MKPRKPPRGIERHHGVDGLQGADRHALKQTSNGSMMKRFAVVCQWLALLGFLGAAANAAAQAQDVTAPKTVVTPQPWWPTVPQPLPFVHSLFTDDMVLQREIAAPIWGWSTPGDRITITLDWEKSDGRTIGPVAIAGSDGKWMTKIGPLKAGGPHTLTMEGTQPRADARPPKVTLKNVLVGDVWLCSGQSNMNWPVRLSDNADEEVLAELAAYQIRAVPWSKRTGLRLAG